jgi:hypothetical protein
MALKLNDKQKIGAVIGVFAAGFGLVAVLVWFQIVSRSELLADMDKLQTRESSAQDKIKRIPGLLEDRATLAATVEKYAEILPEDQHVQHDAFVDTIDSYRRDTKMIIQKAEHIAVKETKKAKSAKQNKESFVRHRYRFSLVGTVPDFIDFVHKIENHTRFLKVDAFTIKPLEVRDNKNASDSAKDSTGPEASELRNASNKLKQIELTISTYTYTGAKDSKKQS